MFFNLPYLNTENCNMNSINNSYLSVVSSVYNFSLSFLCYFLYFLSLNEVLFPDEPLRSKIKDQFQL